jgi:hypothetical protein
MARKPRNDDLAVEFEQRKIGADRYESIPRRRSDKRLFDTLTARQQEAFSLIEEGRDYDLTGLPCARMKYSDAPGGYDYELTPHQLQVVFDFREWKKRVDQSMPACAQAVLWYIDGKKMRDIERALSVRNGEGSGYISLGLNEFCIMKKWGDQSKPAPQAKMRGIVPDDQGQVFEANDRSITGQHVRDFKIPIDAPGPLNVS